MGNGLEFVACMEYCLILCGFSFTPTDKIFCQWFLLVINKRKMCSL